MSSSKNTPKWHKLDNTATIFPLITRKNFSNVYRIGVELKTPIKPEILQEAVDYTLPSFSNFSFRMRRGVFWNYFEKSDSRLIISEEFSRPCSYLESSVNGDYLVKILYYNKKIALEVFHAIADGTGALNFLKVLTINYLKLLSGQKLERIKLSGRGTPRIEDSYTKNYQPSSQVKQKLDRGFRIKGDKLPITTMGVIQGFLNLENALSIAKNNNVTLTVYIASVYVWSIYEAFDAHTLKGRPIQVAIPVNLRRFFGSTTNLNFFSHITLSIPTHQKKWSFDEVLESVKLQFEHKISKENFERDISQIVALQKKMVMRLIPLPIKTLLVRILHIASIQAYTSTLTNVGKVDMPSEWEDDVAFFEVLMNSTALDPIKCGMSAYRNLLVVTLTSQLESTEVQRRFFEKLREDGFIFEIESNGVYHEIL